MPIFRFKSVKIYTDGVSDNYQVCFLRLGLGLHYQLVLHKSDARISSKIYRRGEQESLNGCYWVLVYV